MDKFTKWMILATISTGAFMASLDGSIVNITLPTLVKTFDTNFTDTKWIVLVYYLIVTSFILPFGRLGDVIGRKKIYLTGFVIFTIGSLLCGLSNSLLSLTISRAIQGLGGAMLMSLGFAIITSLFGPKERGKALGIVATSVSIAIITGPVLGGLILEYFSWRFIFYINIPVGIFGVYMIIKYIEPDKVKNSNMFNIKSAVSLFSFMISLLMGISSAGKTGLSIATIILFSVFIASLILLIIFELKAKNPIMDFGMFKNHTFTIGLVSGISVFISLSGVLVLLPFYLENILGFKSGKAGMLISIIPLFMGISSPIAGVMADKLGSNKITIAGIIMLLAGFIAVSGISTNTTVTEFLTRLVLIGTGMGFFMTPNNNAIMGSVPKNRLGVSSGMLALSRTLGQALGVAILGALWTRKTDIFLSTVTADKLTAKMLALQSTFSIVIIIITLILIINIYAFIRNRKLVITEEYNLGSE
ncbi:MAG: MFS transporter [Desulfobacterales bacterium]|nr:MFS transporter [Desulfobacterales bacterium]MCP4159447.1 MFS transporter [Deltaproteobacteria bacterium]